MQLFLGLVVEALDIGDHVINPAGGQQIGLLDVGEQHVVLPIVVLEALVAFLLAHHRFHRLAKQGGQGLLPQFHVALPQIHLRLRQLRRVGHDFLGHLHKGFAQHHRILHIVFAVTGLAAQKILDDDLTFFSDMGKELRHLRRIGHFDFRQFQFRGFWIGH